MVVLMIAAITTSVFVMSALSAQRFSYELEHPEPEEWLYDPTTVTPETSSVPPTTSSLPPGE